MSTSTNVTGIVKKRLTGNQRRKVLAAQASVLRISASELLYQRRSMRTEWHNEKHALIDTRCPNCGAFGHSFKFCPFANCFPSRMDNTTRFRGPNGSWACESPLELSLEEKRLFDQHFRFLDKPLPPTLNKDTLAHTWKQNQYSV